ncbi:hypothetical protein HanLR1_Chr17g0670861 [Helianthus annuus]|nr:hypothetical protein HanHA89_Chr17g0712351 [Helianthus annuus]KAJ0632936.1 hypothetical protein HanLR1_Chr17g0670861 [Helianthus annuus]
MFGLLELFGCGLVDNSGKTSKEIRYFIVHLFFSDGPVPLVSLDVNGVRMQLKGGAFSVYVKRRVLFSHSKSVFEEKKDESGCKKMRWVPMMKHWLTLMLTSWVVS